jgi:hypothetical protein
MPNLASLMTMLVNQTCTQVPHLLPSILTDARSQRVRRAVIAVFYLVDRRLGHFCREPQA